MKKKAILLIDGENFLYQITKILKSKKLIKSKQDLSGLNLRKLIDSVFKSEENLDIKEIRFYAAKLHVYPETKKLSMKLIEGQRKLKAMFENQGINFVLSGNVRARKVEVNGKSTLTFSEKGVDVKIGVDMVAFAYEKTADVLILCSSDSDLQPAVAQAKKKGIEVIYLGFGDNPNKGLTYTTDSTVLFREPEIIKAFKKH